MYSIRSTKFVAASFVRFSLVLVITFLPKVSPADNVTGAGALTCGYMLERLDTAPNEASRKLHEDSFRSWMQGYISALNVEVFDATVMADKDPFAEFSVVKQYCRQNLTDMLVDAVIWYYLAQIKKTNSQHPSQKYR